MFVHVQDDATQDKWAFFFKNWGNEGYCGDNDEPLDWPTQNVFRVRLRHPVGSGFELGQNVWTYGDDDSCSQQQWSFDLQGDSALMTFHLREPGKQCGFVGDLTINWGAPSSTTGAAGAGVTSARPGAVAVSHHYEEDGDPALKAKVARLSSDDQKLLAAELKKLKTHKKAVKVVGTRAKESFTPPPKPTTSYPNYARAAATPNPTGKAEKEKRRDVVLTFLKAHGVG
jgi:hypothetical protein